MIRGDANLGRYVTPVPARSTTRSASPWPMTRRWCERATTSMTFAILTTEFEFSAGTATRRPMRAIRSGPRSAVESIERLIRLARSSRAVTGCAASWPASSTPRAPTAAASGGCRTPIQRSSSGPPAPWTRSASPTCIEDPKQSRTGSRSSGCWAASKRSCGSSTPPTRRSPASGRSRAVAIKSDANLRVASIEPLGLELPMYDITTGTGDFIANGVVSHNCFARNTPHLPGPGLRARLQHQGRGEGERAAAAAGEAGLAPVGAASTSRWAPTSTATSGPRAATS